MKYTDYSPKVRKYLTWSLEYAIKRRISDMFKKHQKVPTHMVMAGNVMKASPNAINEFKETGEEALKMLPKVVRDGLNFDEAWQSVPVPIVTPLPHVDDDKKMYSFMEYALNQSESLMYIYVTEAIGTPESVLNQNEKLFASKPSDAHPDNISNYVVLSIMANKLKPKLVAAEVTRNIINREGEYGRKLGSWKQHHNAKLFTSNLPTTQHLQPDWRNNVR